MEQCKGCTELTEALEASVQLIYYVLQRDLTPAERVNIKSQIDIMFKDMAGNLQQPSVDNLHNHKKQP
jgi:hypothetical protein